MVGVESVEPTGHGGTRVYNLEVAGSHTYFANGLLVSNCHHAASKTYKNVLSHFDGAKVLGVTATPDRSDRLALGKVFESVAYVYDIVDAIRDKHLVPLTWENIEIDGLDLDSVGTAAGDLNLGELDEKMADAKVLEGVTHATVERAGDRQTILFTTSVANAHAQALILNNMRAGCARAVDGETDAVERAAIMHGFRRGEFQFLSNCGIATEGFDAPAAAVISIGRPTKSRSLFVQMVGRGLRPYPGKDRALVLTFGSHNGRHNLITPVDILGGKYRDEEAARAKKLLEKKPGLLVGEALEIARKSLIDEAEAGRRAKKKVGFKSTDFDPFDTLRVDPGRETDDDWQFGARPPTPNQLQTIAGFGIDTKQVRTKRQATEILDKLVSRRRAGLATFKQLTTLTRHGLGFDDLTFGEASALIEALVKPSFGKWYAPPDIWQRAGVRQR